MRAKRMAPALVILGLTCAGCGGDGPTQPADVPQAPRVAAARIIREGPITVDFNDCGRWSERCTYWMDLRNAGAGCAIDVEGEIKFDGYDSDGSLRSMTVYWALDKCQSSLLSDLFADCQLTGSFILNPDPFCVPSLGCINIYMMRPGDTLTFLKHGEIAGGWPEWATTENIIWSTFQESIRWDDVACPG